MALVGRIARAHGIRGQVIVNPETDFPEDRFQPGAELFIERDGRIEALKVTSARFHGARPVIGIDGVETMNDAGTLAGRELRVPVERLAALPADTFYRHDLVGCVVETRDGTRIGPVTDVEGSMTGSRLVVDGAAGAGATGAGVRWFLISVRTEFDGCAPCFIQKATRSVLTCTTAGLVRGL